MLWSLLRINLTAACRPRLSRPMKHRLTTDPTFPSELVGILIFNMKLTSPRRSGLAVCAACCYHSFIHSFFIRGTTERKPINSTQQ